MYAAQTGCLTAVSPRRTVIWIAAVNLGMTSGILVGTDVEFSTEGGREQIDYDPELQAMARTLIAAQRRPGSRAR
jgi:hypothetical protein